VILCVELWLVRKRQGHLTCSIEIQPIEWTLISMLVWFTLVICV